MTKKRIEYGDFQTPLPLAQKVIRLVKEVFPTPSVVIEPTCGQGSFLKASLEQFGKVPQYYGFEINPFHITGILPWFQNYVSLLIEIEDFFEKDWELFFQQKAHEHILIVGNPPWVTNSALSSLDSANLPRKSNFLNLSGFAAKTGNANFDIAEWMLIELLTKLCGPKACIAMLCKTTTARKVLKYLWKAQHPLSHTSLHHIDTLREFGATVDACLFMTHVNGASGTTQATVYHDLSFKHPLYEFGLLDNELIANLQDYQQLRSIQLRNVAETEHYRWRSGIKHDASKVMELTFDKGTYWNGFGQEVDIEEEYVFPLLKSSDLGNQRLIPRKFIVVPQRILGADTSLLQQTAPKLWSYLTTHASILDRRKSLIYTNRPRFSVFGLGDYSFSEWKVAISGMYKNLIFSAIGPYVEKPVMLDDTCYFISCKTEPEALLIYELLNSDTGQRFLRSLIFFDAKRPVKIDILRRIDLYQLALHCGREEEMMTYFPMMMN